MIEDFDKEIDALLRQSAQGETASAAGNRKPAIETPKSEHLDADEISLFAENALPEKARVVYTKHFADCGRCREILSNVISLNAEETRAEAVSAEEIKRDAATPIPWYRRLFAAPNLAYALGALILIFGALIALTFLKSVPRDSDILQTRETPTNIGGASANGDETKTIETNAAMTNSASAMSNAGSTISNTATTTSAADSGAPTAAASMSNNSLVSNSATPNKQSEPKSETTKKETTKSEAEKTETAKNDAPVEENSVAATNDKTRLQAGALNLAEQKRTTTENKETVSVADNSAKSAAVVSADAPSTKPQPRAPAARAAPPAKQNRIMKAENIETRQSGGKIFRRENGVWYDSAYGGQGATNIRRGSEDFKKLDSGLRAVADAFSRTVVVLWKGKAYRIQ